MENKSNLILIIVAVLVVIALGLSAVSVVLTSSVLNKIDKVSSDNTSDDDVKSIPITQTIDFEFSDSLIATLLPKTDSNKVANLSIDIGFKLDKENKKTNDIITLLGDNEGYLRDKISKILATKSSEDLQQPGFRENLQQEILTLVRNELDTDTIIQVYFKNFLTSIK